MEKWIYTLDDSLTVVFLCLFQASSEIHEPGTEVEEMKKKTSTASLTHCSRTHKRLDRKLFRVTSERLREHI